jgi:hypothetical protein
MRQSKGARLYLEPERHKNGKLYQRAIWVIRDGSRKVSTGCTRDDRARAEQKLAEHIASKYKVSRERDRHPAQILVLDALNIYLTDVAPKRARPEEIKQRVLTLAEFFEGDTLANINGARCREYVTWRTKQFRKACKPEKTNRPALQVTEATARRELEDLRAAINHHRQEGLCSEIVSVVLPEKSRGRDVWLTRSQAARLIWAAWRANIARFILVGLYTGSRHRAICGAAFHEAIGRGH